MSDFAHSVLDTVGTWAGAALAAIALVGIVTSWIVLRELHSEKTNALNYLHDRDNPPFIARGWPFGRRARIFRRVRVPDLTPYDAWAAGSRFVVPKAGEPWVLRTPEAPSCRTGWARLCRLLDAYQVGGQGQMKLGTRGELLFEDGETWLPVSRYWILSVGLLGRYGHREDRGVHFSFAERMIRPDLAEQLIWSSPPGSPSGLRRGTSRPIVTGPPPPTQIWGTTGSFQMDLPSESGRQSLRNRDRLRFKLHIKEQLGPLPSSNGARPACQKELPFMFWLAIGFLPCSIGSYKTIASLEFHPGSEPLAERANSFNPAGPGADQVKYWQTHEYDDRKDRRPFPQSLDEAGHALGANFSLVTCLQNTTEVYLRDPTGAEIEHIKQCAQQSLPEGSRRWLRIEDVHGKYFVPLFRRVDLQSLAGSLLSITWDPWSYLVRKDGPNLLWWLLQSLPPFFDKASKSQISPDVKKIAPDYCARLSEALRSLAHREMDPDNYDQRQTAHLLALADLAKEPFPDGDHLRQVVGILYITARSFRELVHTLFKARTLESSSIVAKFDNSSRELTWLFDYSDFCGNRGGDEHSESGDSHSEPGDDEPDPEQMVWVHLRTSLLRGYSISHLTEMYPLSAVVRKAGLGKVRVLRMKRKDVEDDRTQEMGLYATMIKGEKPDNKIIIVDSEYDDLVDLEEQVELQIMGDEYDASLLKKMYDVTKIVGKEGRVETTHRKVFMKYKDAMDLMRDYHDRRDKAADVFPSATAGDVFQVDVPFDEIHRTEPVADLTKDEVVLACLWATTKCALWSKSLDSDPLMRMVHQLSDVVLVS
ncbi:hypothetical protein QQX98_001323 [Neonectria punicea]|uniref:Uncharacterized protein n=1 Tax=Neonectria punicea TaxID=979145 RepID=A0ABR1HQM1_9HYPO